MKITSIFKVAGLCAVLTLASCGGDSGTTAPTTTSGTSAGTTVTPNTGTVTVNTAPNNVVSIGASGTNAKVADATGKAVFTGLTPGAVDVHVFSADGYSASSLYGVNMANPGGTFVQTPTTYVDVYTSIINADAYGQSVFFQQDGANDYDLGFYNSTLGVSILSFYQNPVGSTVSGTLYMGQGKAVSSAGNSIIGFAEMLNLGKFSFITTANPFGTPQASVTATFAAVPPTPPTLVTVNSINVPAGTTMGSLQLNSSQISVLGVGGGALALPDTVKSASFGVNDWFLYSNGTTATATKLWDKRGVYTVGGTIDIAPTLGFPTVAANQSGATISWANGTGSSSFQSVYISDKTYDWSITTQPGVTSITLPTVPSIAKSPLTIGAKYSLDIGSVAIGGATSLEQLFSISAQPSDIESIDLVTSYTR